jgi:uncharacterized SAM-binding protein YcdF (DUF218 family)
MIFLHKIAPLILSPLSLALILLMASLLTNRAWPRVLALVILLVASNPLVARMSVEYLEKDTAYRPVSDLKPTDKAIVLSGMIETVSVNDAAIHYEFNGAVDRYEAAIEILGQNKARKIIFTRGVLPWSTGKPEGEVLAELARKRGIDPENIILTERVQNTDDEAIAIKKLLAPTETPLLITSAFHMPRAQSIFEGHGIRVDPYPVDFHASHVQFSVLDLIPKANALSANSNALRELLGRAYYRLKSLVSDPAGDLD